jgi:threonine/homoserine/homoserine lactone efflux protein
VGWIYTELVLVSLTAMLSPTTLTFSVLALVLSPRPFRSGCWFLLGALTATLAIGILAAFVIGDHAASSTPSTPKTWVAILDVVFAALLLGWGWRLVRRPPDPRQTKAAIDRMSGLAGSPAIAIVGAGALLANPGGFIPIALKTISETDPSRLGYAVQWLFFTIVALLPLIVAVVMLLFAPERTRAVLAASRNWLERNAMRVAAVIILLLALALLRNGIAGLTA